MLANLRATPTYFLQPAELLDQLKKAKTLQADLIAGLTVAVILLPQAIAYALIAELPAEMGLYTAIVGAIVGALWGASDHLHTGPTNTASLLTLTVLLTVAVPGTQGFIVAAGMMAVMVGVFRLLMGLARLGMLVNFISDSVIVGFTAGAGVLIAVGQLKHLMRLSFPSDPGLVATVQSIVRTAPETHLPTLVLGLATMAALVTIRQVNRKLPGPLIGMVGAALAVALLGLDDGGVAVIGELPRSLPPLSLPPIFDLELVGQLSTGALAVATIGLVEAMSISRSIAAQTGQRLDNNQELVGQGMANIATGLFSGFVCSGSFTRSAVNYKAGAQTRLAAVFSALFVLIAMFLLAPLAAFVPRTALAAVLIVTAYGMIDRAAMARIWRGAKGDALIMVVTLVATLLLPLQFAVLAGILMSLGYYLLKTSTPHVVSVLPDDQFRHFVSQPEKSQCPQLGIFNIHGDLYFGACNHIEEQIHRHLMQNPRQRFLLMRMHSVNHIDMSGINTLESIWRTVRDRGGDLFFVRLHPTVLERMKATGFYDKLGAANFLDEDEAISHLFTRQLDPAICIYECPVRAFRECQNLPKPEYTVDIPLGEISLPDDVAACNPKTLWQELRGSSPPLVLDVREPREFRQGHVPSARLLPFSRLLENGSVGAELPTDRPIVCVCRSGRRSTRAAALLRRRGHAAVSTLEGGILAWEAAGLLEAVGEDEDRDLWQRGNGNPRKASDT